MSNAELRNANRLWAAVQRIQISRGGNPPMTVGEVAREAMMSAATARKYLNAACETGAMERHVHNATFSTYVRIYSEDN